MQKRRFTEEQIIAALREAEARAKVAGSAGSAASSTLLNQCSFRYSSPRRPLKLR